MKKCTFSSKKSKIFEVKEKQKQPEKKQKQQKQKKGGRKKT